MTEKKPSGILIVNKEKGMTSFDVIFHLRRLLDIKKMGHTGTLDPDAEGVLPVCIGRATKVVDMLTGMTKTYRAAIRLGVVTDTQDLSGTVLEENEVHTDAAELRAAIESFEGDREQIPPMYSAVKVNGKKLVDLARKGVEVERKPRMVRFEDIRVLDVKPGEAEFEVTCSKGAYIRTLCHDIGQKIGCGAAMASLIRTRVGPFELGDARTLSRIKEELGQDENRVESLRKMLIPIDRLFNAIPAVTSGSPKQDAFLLNGCDLIRKTDLPDDARCRVYLTDGSFVGLYRYQAYTTHFKLEKFFYDLSDGSN